MEWGAQLACCLTSYVVVGICAYATMKIAATIHDDHHGRVTHAGWYLLYFLQIMFSTCCAIVLHTLAYEALTRLDNNDKNDLDQTQNPPAVVLGVFGMMARSSMESWIGVCWNLVLTLSISSDLTLFGLFATESLHDPHQSLDSLGYSILMAIAFGWYSVLLVLANLTLEPYFLGLGLLPVIVLGITNTNIRVLWERATTRCGQESSMKRPINKFNPVQRRAWNQLAIVVTCICTLVIQTMHVSLSQQNFDYHALSYVFVALRLLFIFANFHLDQKCSRQYEQQHQSQLSRLKWYGSINTTQDVTNHKLVV